MKRPQVFAALCAVLVPTHVYAAGFEVGENTALANARGGTGLVSRTDAAATTLSPGRLAFVNGAQIVLSANLVDLNVTFERDPLALPDGSMREFDPVSNVAPPFPVPYLAATWDLGLENLTVGISASGPHAYGRRCMTELVDGECIIDFENAARHMVVSTELFQVYALASVGYAFEFDAGKLGFGLSGGPAYQDTNVTLVVDQVSTSVGPPFTENPNAQGVFGAKDLRQWKPVFIGGVAWEGADGMRLGAAYRPPIIWNAVGRLDLELPEAIRDFVEVTDDGLTLRAPQAGSLKAGWGYARGEHPGRPDLPAFDVEANVVWENWSVVDAFETAPQGSLLLADVQEQELAPVVQPKDYRDTFALRIGSSWGAAKFASLHAGAFIETAAQRKAVTNADFVSWERYSGSLGATYHLGEFLDVTVSYAYVHSPPRKVTDGAVYSQVPLSRCTYPDYDQEACAVPGTPPGNPQNEGQWRSNFQIAGLQLNTRF